MPNRLILHQSASDGCSHHSPYVHHHRETPKMQPLYQCITPCNVSLLCNSTNSLNYPVEHLQFVSMCNSFHDTQSLLDFTPLHCSFPHSTTRTVLTEHPHISLQNSAFFAPQVLNLPLQDQCLYPCYQLLFQCNAIVLAVAAWTSPRFVDRLFAFRSRHRREHVLVSTKVQISSHCTRVADQVLKDQACTWILEASLVTELSHLK